MIKIVSCRTKPHVNLFARLESYFKTQPLADLKAINGVVANSSMSPAFVQKLHKEMLLIWITNHKVLNDNKTVLVAVVSDFDMTLELSWISNVIPLCVPLARTHAKKCVGRKDCQDWRIGQSISTGIGERGYLHRLERPEDPGIGCCKQSSKCHELCGLWSQDWTTLPLQENRLLLQRASTHGSTQAQGFVYL